MDIKELYIFGCGGGALHIMQDNLWYLKDKQINFKPEEITFVEDEPKSDFVIIAGIKYSLIAFKDLKSNPIAYGHISAFNIPYKECMSKLKLIWLNSYSKNYVRFPDIKMGNGVRINWATYIDGKVSIGNFVKLNAFTFLGHDSIVGDFTYISQHVVLDNHATIGEKCYIFENSTILPNVNIGSNTIIGAGSVVTKDIPANKVAYGIPCKVVKNNC